jgi:hypothetical protein
MFEKEIAELFNKEVPKILEKLKAKGIDILSDEDNIKLVLEKSYELLPTPVRLMVKRDSFIAFGMDNKNKLLAFANENAAPKPAAEPVAEVPIPAKKAAPKKKAAPTDGEAKPAATKTPRSKAK